MAESDSMKEVINHAAVWAATTIMMALREAKPQLTTTVSHTQPQAQRHGGPEPMKPTFNWRVQDRYVQFGVDFSYCWLNLEEQLYSLEQYIGCF